MNILNRLQAAVLAILMLGTLTGCGGGAASGGETGSGDPVRIATKPMTEQYILGEILGLLIEQAGYDVEITKGVGGGTSNIQPAMESGEFDLYPEYTSSGWVLVLDHQAEGVDDAEMFTRLQQEYEEKFHMTWVGKYGFNNTFTVAVRGDVAEQYGLETTSDLAGAAGELILRRKPGLSGAGGRLSNPVQDLRPGLPECGGHRHRPEIPGPGRRRYRRDQRLHHRRPTGESGHRPGDAGG